MPGGLPKRTARALLDIEDKHYVPVIRDPKRTTAESEAVFYFPGCGSERLFSQIGLATLSMLYEVGAQTVLPPGYLCCGYPQTSSGDEKKGLFRRTFNGGVVGVVVADGDGDGAAEVIAAVRLAGATRVDLWRLD